MKLNNFKWLIFGLIVTVSPLAQANADSDQGLFNQLLPGKYPVSVVNRTIGSSEETYSPAIQKIEIGNDEFLVCCYRDNAPQPIAVQGCKDCERDSGQLIHIVFFKKQNDNFVLIGSPFLIEKSKFVNKLMPNWLEGIKKDVNGNLLIIDFHANATTTMHVIFRINNPDVVLLGEIIGSTFDVEDLKKNGELELISKTYELGDVYAPPTIYRLTDNKLVDSSSSFPEFYQDVLNFYDEQISRSDRSDDWKFEVETMKLDTYRIVGGSDKASYVEQIKSEVGSRISKIKSDPKWKDMDLTKPAYRAEDMPAVDMNREVKQLENYLKAISKDTEAN